DRQIRLRYRLASGGSWLASDKPTTGPFVRLPFHPWFWASPTCFPADVSIAQIFQRLSRIRLISQEERLARPYQSLFHEIDRLRSRGRHRRRQDPAGIVLSSKACSTLRHPVHSLLYSRREYSMSQCIFRSMSKDSRPLRLSAYCRARESLPSPG